VKTYGDAEFGKQVSTGPSDDDDYLKCTSAMIHSASDVFICACAVTKLLTGYKLCGELNTSYPFHWISRWTL